MTELRFLVSLITQDNDYQMEQAAAAKSADPDGTLPSAKRHPYRARRGHFFSASCQGRRQRRYRLGCSQPASGVRWRTSQDHSLSGFFR